MNGSSTPLHDEINLVRLLRRLDTQHLKGKEPESELQLYIKAQGTLQKVKFARKLLRNVELAEEDATPKRTQFFDDIRAQIDAIESAMKEVEEPAPPRLTPILPTLPRPSPARPPTLDLPSVPSAESTVQTDDLLLPADTPSYPSSTSFVFPTPMPLLTPSLPLKPTTATTNAASTSTSISSGLSTATLRTMGTTSLHQELSSQLEQMASQLKRNAMHFADTLTKDAAVVEETQTKLESNFDVMQKERVRLRDHRGKSGSTTCLTVMIILAVLLLFVIMVGLIRFSRR